MKRYVYDNINNSYKIEVNSNPEITTFDNIVVQMKEALIIGESNDILQKIDMMSGDSMYSSVAKVSKRL